MPLPTTILHHPPPSNTIYHPPPSTTTHHQPKYIHHHPPPPTTSQSIFTTIHHHSPPPTTSQNTSTTTHHHPKNGLPHSKSQNIFIYCFFWHCFNSFFFFEMQYFRDGDFSLCRIDDWKPRIRKTLQVTEQVELNRVNFTNVVIFNNKNFWLLQPFFYNI